MKFNFLCKITLGLALISNFSFAQNLDIIAGNELQIQTRLWKLFSSKPTVYQNIQLADFTETGLYAQFKNQPFSKQQTPNTINNYGFNSKGIFTLKNNYKLFGNLDFSRSYTQNASYQLFHHLADEFSNELLKSPNYPLAKRVGNGENLHYHLTGGITGNIKNKFPFSVKINYNLDKYFGLTIPKTEQEIINYSAEFELGYQFKKHHVFSILHFDKTQNNFTLSSKENNTVSINSIAEPNYYTAFSIGYGDILGYNGTLLDGIIDTESKTFGGGYRFSNNNQTLTAIYQFTEGNERYYSTTFVDENNLAAIFNRQENNLEFSYLKFSKQQRLIINGNLYYGKGTNTHAFENFIENSDELTIKTNYQQEITQVNIETYWEKRKNDFTQIGINFNNLFEENTRNNVNTTHQKIIRFSSELSANKDVKLNKTSFFNIEAGLLYDTPLSNTLVYQSSNSTTNQGSTIPPSNTFDNDVILYDYEFDTLNKFGSLFKIAYQTQIKSKTLATVTASYNTLTSTQKSTFSNTNNNTIHISLKLAY